MMSAASTVSLSSQWLHSFFNSEDKIVSVKFLFDTFSSHLLCFV